MGRVEEVQAITELRPDDLSQIYMVDGQFFAARVCLMPDDADQGGREGGGEGERESERARELDEGTLSRTGVPGRRCGECSWCLMPASSVPAAVLVTAAYNADVRQVSLCRRDAVLPAAGS